MQNPPPLAVGNVPYKNSFFNEANDNVLGDPPAPLQLPTNLHMAHYVLPSVDTVQESITRPTITANNFEINPTMIQIIQNNLQFRGTMTEDPN
ncbi:hypothetical protein EPI10_015226 [Gossypium australe]|uniref:Uncharacterized protein n=1 Tax=Gossypium australe TaxID=47621 RepID=A0A5B6VJI6_9ROSI|nr:hypothetical protein EPI10_015226 [Gossypium australe]